MRTHGQTWGLIVIFRDFTNASKKCKLLDLIILVYNIIRTFYLLLVVFIRRLMLIRVQGRNMWLLNNLVLINVLFIKAFNCTERQ